MALAGIEEKRERLVVVGAGMAGLKLVEELVELCPSLYDISLIGAEARPAYNRVLLSSLLAGEVGEEDIALRPASWYADHNIELLTGAECVELSPGESSIALRSGASIAYDRLVLATGSTAVRLPIPGRDLPGVITFRDLDDVAT